MNYRKLIRIMAAYILLISAPPASLAVDIETLLMPGEVISGHAKFESDCSSCHTRFSKNTQTRLCLDCHEKVAADITARDGFHGRIVKDGDTCKQCHSEHLGRGADIVRLNPATFNHNDTDFLLQGKHRSTSCSACHDSDEPYRNAPSDCKSCHGKQDPHKGKLGETCADCHTPKSWDQVRFDHDKTDFRLQGKHADTACDACHINERYARTPVACNSCHALDDVHNGANGQKCSDCHNQSDWSKSRFDHTRETKFPLKGLHKDINCKACHTKSVKEALPHKDCISCHKNDDRHHGRYGKTCQSCHTEAGWARSNFNHDIKTDFALKGGHQELTCSACHSGNLSSEKLSGNCIDCHRNDDVHKGQEGKQCARCHSAAGWGENIVFDHDVTHFPLLGLHATAPCEECHVSAAFRDTPGDCISCHRNDDAHEAMLGEACHQCHNPNSWAIWDFDHTEQTRFALDGSHENLRCIQCHNKPSPANLKLSTQCNACHRQDDVHKGQFGSNCSRCHTNEDFQDVQINY